MVSRVITIVPSVPSAYCGAFDIAYMATSDEAELMHIVATAAAIDDTEPVASGNWLKSTRYQLIWKKVKKKKKKYCLE
uniref:Uncharacterized protein n=1 Tax=Salix viminalis TaxID=40686 RepID=A0A6N2L666_SALVM